MVILIFAISPNSSLKGSHFIIHFDSFGILIFFTILKTDIFPLTQIHVPLKLGTPVLKFFIHQTHILFFNFCHQKTGSVSVVIKAKI